MLCLMPGHVECNVYCTKNKVFQVFRRKQWIWSHLLKRSVMENVIFCAIIPVSCNLQVRLRDKLHLEYMDVYAQLLEKEGKKRELEK